MVLCEVKSREGLMVRVSAVVRVGVQRDMAVCGSLCDVFIEVY